MTTKQGDYKEIPHGCVIWASWLNRVSKPHRLTDRLTCLLVDPLRESYTCHSEAQAQPQAGLTPAEALQTCNELPHHPALTTDMPALWVIWVSLLVLGF